MSEVDDNVDGISGRCGKRAARGSLTVELVVLTPLVALFVLVALAFGRYSLAREQVVGGAQAAVTAVAAAGSALQAQQVAIAAALPVLNSGHACIDPSVVVDSRSFEPGATVRVAVSCHVEFSDLLVPGFPGSTTVDAIEVAVIDPYRAVQP